MEVLNKENILVIQTAFLGDAILTLPMIQELKNKYPDSRLTVLSIPSTQEIFRNSNSVDEVIVYDKRKRDKSLFSFVKLILQIRLQNYTRVYSPHRSLRSALVTFFSGSKYSVSFNTSSMSFLYKERKTYNSKTHEVARNLSLIGFNCDYDNWKIKPKIIIPSEIEEKISLITSCFTQRKIIAIAPGSVWKTKVYPEKYFSEIISELIKMNFIIILIGGSEDKILCERIASQFTSNVHSFAGSFSIVESIAVLKKCEAIICNDSAPTHLAMIADIPALTIYCSTISGFGFFPYNSKSKSISFDNLKCKPCGIHGHNECPTKTFDCGNKLLPSVVITQLKEIIPV